MLRRLAAPIAALFLALFASLALAIGVDEPLADPAAEQRAREISRSLRCLVCQNQSIEDSNAALARDLRRIVRERIEAGDSDGQVRAYLVARYGDWVLLNPPFKATTYLLWFAPILLLMFAIGGVMLYYRHLRARARSEVEPAALSAEERGRIKELLSERTGP
ncbi:MAG: cytochrome c-type biogenesis protein CcmH [Alphaproteobacteria bacterium]|nr:cytochrome c-type biogenesis protein CcmH [Alphaproteobacteria bacterium]